ncbi:MAG TPA: hypothetical protein VF245_03320 [Solirubrobacterales bacterium]
MKRTATVLALAALALATVAAVKASAATRGLQLGLADATFTNGNAAVREEWLGRARDAGAELVLLGVDWSAIAPRAPSPGFDAADAADPAYDWAALDAAVRSAVAQGLTPVLDVQVAPPWAEGPGRPSADVAPPGTWKPSARALGEFAAALASRYDGAFPDSGDSGAGPLPQVRWFQIWAEQNLSQHLNPLWENGRLVAPAHYRQMLNAAYAAIHGVNSGARVLVGGLAPYGDAVIGGARVPPVWFWRSLLCLRGARLRPLPCPDPARFDVAAHNPIDVWGPRRGALSPLDVSVPDIGRLRAIVRRAVATHRALPASPKPFWATELWWDSSPPDPRGVPVHRQARFLGEALYELWRQRVSVAIWWFLRDQAPGSEGFAATQQSGLLFRDGAAKPAYAEFRFPFVARREADGRALLWGRAPATGPVALERPRRSGGWAPLTHAVAGASRVFVVRIAAAGHFQIRARQGGEASLPASLAAGKGGSQ